MFRAHVLIVRRAKIVLYSLWYHHSETSEWSKITKIIKIIKIQFYKYEHMVVHVLILINLYFNNFNYFSNFRPITCFSVMLQRLYNTIFALLTMSTCARNMQRLEINLLQNLVVNLFDRKVLNKEMLYRHCFSTLP
jgi:hypothetical protein